MEFIIKLLSLFTYLFRSSLIFEPIILLFIGVVIVLILFQAFEYLLKGSYKK